MVCFDQVGKLTTLILQTFPHIEIEFTFYHFDNLEALQPKYKHKQKMYITFSNLIS